MAELIGLILASFGHRPRPDDGAAALPDELPPAELPADEHLQIAP